MNGRDDDPSPRPVTRLLADVRDGRPEAPADLMALVYDELHRIAEACFRSQPAAHTLQPTALVHEAFARLVGGDPVGLDGRRRFFALAARAMRQILVDHARTKRREKRGGTSGAARIGELSEHDVADASHPLGTTRLPEAGELIDLDEALRDLAERDRRQAELVELRFFGGLEMQDVAACLDVSLSTAEREWRAARAWLGQRLAGM